MQYCKIDLIASNKNTRQKRVLKFTIKESAVEEGVEPSRCG